MCGSGKEENRMLQLLSGSQRTVDALGFLLAFALTALMDSVFREKLPHDHGRAFAVNGELSKGKARGSGLIFVLCIALVTLAVVPLPIAGLMNDLPVREMAELVAKLDAAWKQMGCVINSPYMTMALVPLACLPELRLTNRGLVDCRTFRFVPLFAEE